LTFITYRPFSFCIRLVDFASGMPRKYGVPAIGAIILKDSEIIYEMFRLWTLSSEKVVFGDKKSMANKP